MVTSDSEAGKFLCSASITATGAIKRLGGSEATFHAPPIFAGDTNVVSVAVCVRASAPSRSITARNCGLDSDSWRWAANSNIAIDNTAATTTNCTLKNLQLMTTALYLNTQTQPSELQRVTNREMRHARICLQQLSSKKPSIEWIRPPAMGEKIPGTNGA